MIPFPLQFADATWPQVKQAASDLVVVLPIGATEAHGPHLPLSTDVIIASGMAKKGAALLRAAGTNATVAPPLAYTAADFAKGFAGTLSVRPVTASTLLFELGRGFSAHGIRTLVLANAHLDPAHIGSLRTAAKNLEKHFRGTDALKVVFPDVTQKPWALRLTEEFKSGACHAGQYEGSIVMAERPDLVREDVRQSLPPNPQSLSSAIREGKDSFESAGGPQAYFGHPAQASAEEGRQTLQVLGEIVRDAVLEGPQGAGKA